MTKTIKDLGHPESDLAEIKELILRDAESIIDKGSFAVQDARDALWIFKKWPPYIDHGALPMANIQNELIGHDMAKYFLKILYKELNKENPATYRLNGTGINRTITYVNSKKII